MTNSIKTIHLDEVVKKHTQDISHKVVAVTGTTSGAGFICGSIGTGRYFIGWFKHPDHWVGCEKAVGAFKI